MYREVVKYINSKDIKEKKKGKCYRDRNSTVPKSKIYYGVHS
jgi:hypothetical protein